MQSTSDVFSLNEHFFLAIGFYVSTGSSEWVEAGI